MHDRPSAAGNVNCNMYVRPENVEKAGDIDMVFFILTFPEVDKSRAK